MSKIGRPVDEEEFTPRPLPERWTVGRLAAAPEMPIGQWPVSDAQQLQGDDKSQKAHQPKGDRS